MLLKCCKSKNWGHFTVYIVSATHMKQPFYSIMTVYGRHADADDTQIYVFCRSHSTLELATESMHRRCVDMDARQQTPAESSDGPLPHTMVHHQSMDSSHCCECARTRSCHVHSGGSQPTTYLYRCGSVTEDTRHKHGVRLLCLSLSAQKYSSIGRKQLRSAARSDVIVPVAEQSSAVVPSQ